MRTFEAENGNTLTALDDVQADAMIKGGLVEVTEESELTAEKKTGKAKESE